MNTAAFYHRPESEYAYLYTEDILHIRLRTAKADVKKVAVLMGDPYLLQEEQWYQQETPMTLLTSTDLYDYWLLETSAKHKRLQYAFHITGVDGLTAFYTDRGVYPFTEAFTALPNFYFRMPFFQEIDRFKSPDWVKQTIWYQIFPERFANGDTTNDPAGTLPWSSQEPSRTDFFGGDLQGVLDHLDYLADLGITGIYFCPLFKASSNHKYDTIDYYEIDPDFGDKALFKKLVTEAHNRGIRIMLDAVFNHTGDSAPQWQDVCKHEANSAYADWFHVNSFPVVYGENGNFEGQATLSFESFAFTPHMPKLNTANPEVQKYLLDIATYWIREFDIDAWRLDVANEVDHHFWKKFHTATTALKEDFYILGEIWHSAQQWLQGDEFHAVMNYAYTETIEDFFVRKQITPSKMVAGLNEQLMLYRQQANEVMFNMLDSHDTARLLTICRDNKDLLRATLAFTFLQHGSPCIYYGTEIGMTGGNDPGCRKCMVWEKAEQDQAILHFTKALIALRKEYQALLSFGRLNWLIVADQAQVIGLERIDQKQELVAVFNQGTTNYSFETKDKVRMDHLVLKGKSSYCIQPGGFIITVKERS